MRSRHDVSQAARRVEPRMRLSVCYLTGRPEPRLDWVLQAIRRQRRRGELIELIVVDALERSKRDLVPDAAGVDHVVVVPPKPNLWQGKHRVTSRDVWAKSQAANTALCLARHDYVVFLDDRCVPGDRWLATVRDGWKQREAVQAGAYERVFGDGRKEVDHRLERCPDGKVDCGGTWLYGCTFALPLEWALEVNGFEEGMDGLAQEDCVFGFNLANAGHRIDFVPSLFVSLHREPSTGHAYARMDGDKFQAALARFRTRKRTEFTPNLRMLRKRIFAGEKFPIPDPDAKDWYDGRAIKDAGGGVTDQSKPDLSLALAMTLAPRREVTFACALESLRDAGFHEDVHVFAEPGTFAQHTRPSGDLLHVHENVSKRGCFANWKYALEQLLAYTTAQWFLVVQDDVIWRRGSAEILREQMRVRQELRTGLLSPYTSPQVVEEGFVDGWNECRAGWGWWGALTFCMKRGAAEELLRHPRFAEHADLQQVDAVVAASMLDLGRPSFVHVPSLADHIGTTSTIGRDGDLARGRRGYRFSEV